MTPQDFKSWRKRLGLTQAQAGQAIGRDRRSIASYEAGVNGRGNVVEIPLAVELACKWVEQQWRPMTNWQDDDKQFIAWISGSLTTFIDDSDPIKGVYPGGDWKVSRINEAVVCEAIDGVFLDTNGFSYGPDFVETSQPEGSPDGDPPLTIILWKPLPQPPETEHAD